MPPDGPIGARPTVPTPPSDGTSDGVAVRSGEAATPGGASPRQGSPGPPAPPGPEPEQAPAEGSGQPPAPTLPRLLTAAGALLGSTTVLTGLLFYFGRMHITGFFRYLRVNHTALDLTLYDHLVRSADGLFVPLTAAAVVGVLAIAGHRLLDRLTPEARERALHTLVPATNTFGVVLVGLALLDLLGNGPVVPGRPWVGGLALSAGVILVAYGTHLARPASLSGGTRKGLSVDFSALAQGAFAFVLVSIGLFWAAGNYAVEVGTGRAQQVVAELPTAADAVIYSERSLRLAVAGVTEVACLDPDAAYRFRYDGLKLVIQSGDQYLLLPSGWTRENGTALLIPRSDAVRLEFAPPGQQRQPVC